MAKGLNKVNLIGNLGKDPEVRYMSDGDAICNLTLATSDSWKDKQTGETKEHTEWHRVSLFGRLAEIAGEYLKKGSKVYIEGSLRTRKYTDSDGIERYATEVRGAELLMLDTLPAQAKPSAEAEAFDHLAEASTESEPLPPTSKTRSRKGAKV